MRVCDARVRETEKSGKWASWFRSVKNSTNLKIRDTGLGASFLPDLSSSVGVQKVQLCILDLLVDPASFGPPIMSDPAVHRCSD